MNQAILQVKNIYLYFGGVAALTDINADIKEGEILAIIGPNGAGKTSLLNCINGFFRSWRGDVFFRGQNVTGMRPDKIARLGIARAFQQGEVYNDLTCRDNILAGRHMYMKANFIEDFFYYGRAKKDECRQSEIVEKIIELLELQSYSHQPVNEVPFGIRKLVDIGRALASEPAVLLLDEPLAGLSSQEKAEIVRLLIRLFKDGSEIHPKIKSLKDRLRSVVLIEHDMRVVMSVADRIIVLDWGRKIAEGTPEEIKNNPRVIESYLGRLRVDSKAGV